MSGPARVVKFASPEQFGISVHLVIYPIVLKSWTADRIARNLIWRARRALGVNIRLLGCYSSRAEWTQR